MKSIDSNAHLLNFVKPFCTSINVNISIVFEPFEGPTNLSIHCCRVQLVNEACSTVFLIWFLAHSSFLTTHSTLARQATRQKPTVDYSMDFPAEDFHANPTNPPWRDPWEGNVLSMMAGRRTLASMMWTAICSHHHNLSHRRASVAP